ncbi:MAG: uncharacterized protein TIGR03905 [Candidatus Frackibacter sp. T328-2]|nr:MAG: uncharacterized protein TIGR03905 [Candidatus Frackibacter sp. T328-2]
MKSFEPEGVCSKEISFTIEEGTIKDIEFRGGCGGNLEAIATLVKGMEVEEVVNKLRGITCRNGTSCPDQLSKAIVATLEDKN